MFTGMVRSKGEDFVTGDMEGLLIFQPMTSCTTGNADYSFSERPQQFSNLPFNSAGGEGQELPSSMD